MVKAPHIRAGKVIRFVVLFLFAGVSLLQTEADNVVDYVPGQVIVMRTPNATAQGLSALGYSALSKPEGAEYEVLATRPGQTVEAAIAELSSRGDVVLAQPNYIYRGLTINPDDTNYSSQYALSIIGAPDAWRIGRGAASETIAICDSGADTTHIDLGARIVTVSAGDIIEGDSDVSDTPSGSGHGTGVAGTAAARTNNGTLVAGVDWFSNLLPIRCLSGADASGTSINIDSAIRHAIRHNARVINLSLGFSGASADALVEAGLVLAAQNNIIVVAAAGNSSGTPVTYPASSTNAIAVGSSNSSDARSSFSSYGAASGMTGIDVMAPGENLLLLTLNSTTRTASGTSFSSPIVAGAASLVRAIRPGLTPTHFLYFLRSTATDIGEAGYEELTGAGRINLRRLMQVATANTNYGDSLGNFGAGATTALASNGRQARVSLPITATDSYAGYDSRHYLQRGTIQFYWKPESVPTSSDTRFVLTQRGNLATAAGNIDLIFRTDRKLEYRMSGIGTIISTTALNKDQWYHVAITYGDSGMALYINGDSEVSRGGSSFPPVADTIYLGVPNSLGSALPAIGRFSLLAFSESQLYHFPSALFVKIERPIVATNSVAVALTGWKAYQTETNGITLEIYADTDQADFNGTLLSSGLANDQNESAPLSSLTLGRSYYLYVVATDDSTSATTSPEKAYAYASAVITVSSPAAVSVSGSAGVPSSGPCLISRLPGNHDWIRSIRDVMMRSWLGRGIAGMYYFLLG